MMKRILVFFFFFFFFLLETVMATSDNLNVLAQKYQELRQISRSSDGDYDEKYQVMKALGDQLGLPGTPAAEILSKFGKPDEMTPSLGQGQASVAMMPGPVIPGSATTSSSEGNGQPPYYFVYYLIPKKEYLYFKIDSAKETVITSDWQKNL